MSSDFRSLLSTFQAATETSHRDTNNSNNTHSASNSNTKKESDSSQTKSESKSKSGSMFDPSPRPISPNLKQYTEKLFQVSQLRKACQSSASSSTTTTTTTTTTSSSHDNNDNNPSFKPKKVHIAICATIVHQFPHESIWKKWMHSSSSTNNTATATAEFYIHAKYPTSSHFSPWVKSKILQHSYRPNWNDVNIVRAMLYQLEHALLEDSTTHIVFCTESCIPIASLDEVAQILIKDNENDRKTNWDQSFIAAYNRKSHKCTRFDEYNCFGALEPFIPQDAIWKALPGWIILSRSHAQDILNLPTQLSNTPIWPAFSKVWAPEEVYFPTSMALLGHLPSNDVKLVSLMHSQWDTKAQNHSDRAHPKAYDDEGLSYNLIERIQNSSIQKSNYKCMFMRKWKEPIDTTLWERIVLQKEQISPPPPKSIGNRQNNSTYGYSYEESRKRHRTNHHDDTCNRRTEWNYRNDHYRDQNYTRRRNNNSYYR